MLRAQEATYTLRKELFKKYDWEQISVTVTVDEDEDCSPEALIAFAREAVQSQTAKAIMLAKKNATDPATPEGEELEENICGGGDA